ncbi:MAG: class I SAM-dependent RNA methyltransferase [Treponemataceae bacterium]
MMTALALCAVGAEKALSNELRKLELPILSSSFGRVRFQADTTGLYRALMALRTADRVLLEAASFPASDFDQLFEGVRSVQWADLIPRGRRVVIAKVRTNRSKLSAETSIQAVAHKAVAEQLCASWKIARLTEVGDSAELRVYIEKDVGSVLLDLSGAPLFHRGYRTEGGAAPLRETTAAALMLLLGWKRKFPLYDPFCGSGTIAIEAALYAWDAAPGIGRPFALNELAIGDRVIAARVRAELAAKVDFTRIIRISGSDIDSRAVSIAQANAERAYELVRGATSGRGARIPGEMDRAAMPSFKKLDMAAAKAEHPEGFIVTNPPYGERLGDVEQAEALYRSMGHLHDDFPGWTLGVITNHAGYESHFGRKADSVREITNGALRSYLYEYDRMGGKSDVDSRRTR